VDSGTRHPHFLQSLPLIHHSTTEEARDTLDNVMKTTVKARKIKIKHEIHLKESVRIIPSSSVIVGIEGAWEAGVGRVDAVAGVF
jgi:hypothetical protein